MYAIVRTGGKQYRVEEGRTIDVDRLPAEEGATVELGDVLLIAEDGTTTVGTPTIEGARVMAQVDQNGRGRKIIVYKYKNKVRTRKKQGHRQNFTRLTVQEILRPGEEAKATQRKPKRAQAPEDGNLDTLEEAAEAMVEMGTAGATEEAAPEVAKPRARRSAAQAEVVTEPPEAVETPVPDDGDLDTEREAAKAIVDMGAAAAAPRKKAAKPAAPKSKPAKAAKDAKPSKAKKDDKKDDAKAPRRRLSLGRKKKEE
jgi:large subunit ribosomal protein L21